MPPTLQFLHGMHTAECDAIVDKHFNNYFALQLMTSGGIRLAYDEHQYALEGAWIWLAMPGPHIRFQAAPDYPFWEHRYVAFTGETAEGWYQRGLLPKSPLPMPTNADYPRLYDELYPLMARPDANGQALAMNHLERILLLLADGVARPSPGHEWLRKVRAALDADDTEPDYHAVAEKVNMAYSTLRRRFRDATGTSLHQYVLERRIVRARHFLAETDDPIECIADRLGYCDVYYFSRQFKQLVGVSPALFRRTRQV